MPHASTLPSSFARDSRGNVATMFAVAAIPALLLMGAAIDYARLLTVQTKVQTAVDAAALAIAQDKTNPTAAQIAAKARAMFDASFTTASGAGAPTFAVDVQGTRFSVNATVPVETSFMRLARIPSVNVSAASVAVNAKRRLEIALVLDNTGSMASAGKMPALKAAVKDLLDSLAASRTSPDDAKVSIVPFNTEVQVDPALRYSTWLRWDVTVDNPALSWAARQPPTLAAWTGCLTDRDQPYDVAAAPVGIQQSRYPASQCHFAGLTRMEPLTSNLSVIRARADAMTPTGNTNVTIGLATGLATLQPASPLGAGSSSASDVDKYVVLLTDGDNTMNRWTSNQTQIDARLTSACDQARTAGVKVFTIRVINGNAPLLRACATTPSMYHDVTDATQLQAVFRNILEAIQGVRLAS